ncbi:MAG: peptidase M28, partial [Acidobacteriota bacterium]
MRRLVLLAALAAVLPGCRSSREPVAPAAAAPMPVSAMPRIEADAILNHIKVLASDEYEGRAPGTKGEDLSVRYLQDQFKALGLKPGNPDGTYTQKVPLVGITAREASPFVVTSGARKQTFTWGDDIVPWTKHVADGASLDQSELVFAGYGVEAPEFNWDDFKDADVKGKTIIVLVNDPAVPDPADPTRLDPKVFGGNAMTYYGRWTYKFEEGARKGAAGILVVHDTGPAGYPFSVVQGNLREKFSLVTPNKNMDRAAVEGWITLDTAKKIFAMAGKDFDALRKQALTRDFKPVALGVKASLGIANTLRTIDSQNVVA